MTSTLPAIRGVVLDLDGTLYLQAPLRRAVLSRLVALPLRRGPMAAYETLRRLRAFRDAREELRALGRPDESLEVLQYRVPAERLGVDEADLRATVLDWIHERPLALLARCARPGIGAFLAGLRAAGVRTAVYSDYPARQKLDALGLGQHVEHDLTSTDPEVNAFKPHPRGFLAAAERLELAPPELLYVGDRDEVDGVGARAAGMAVALLKARGGRRSHEAELDALGRRVLGRGVGDAFA